MIKYKNYMPTKKRILIAEDEKPMAKTLKAKLEASGFEAEIVEDGEKAIEILTQQKFDLILLDLMMPKKDGFAVLEELKAKGNKTPIIVSSNLSQKEDFDRAKEMGADDYFVKSSVQINEVIDHVNKILKLK